jgi:hypothetical protein
MRAQLRGQPQPNKRYRLRSFRYAYKHAIYRDFRHMAARSGEYLRYWNCILHWGLLQLLPLLFWSGDLELELHLPKQYKTAEWSCGYEGICACVVHTGRLLSSGFGGGQAPVYKEILHWAFVSTSVFLVAYLGRGRAHWSKKYCGCWSLQSRSPGSKRYAKLLTLKVVTEKYQ